MKQRSQGRNIERGVLGKIGLWLNRSRLGEILVARGLVNAQQLRDALHVQKETRLPLGQVFVAQRVISQGQLSSILRRQAMIRAFAGSLFFFGAMTGNLKKSRADVLKDSSTQITLASAPVMGEDLSRLSSYPALFGTAEKRSSNLRPFTKWTGLFARFDQELQHPSSDSAVQAWEERLSAFRGLPLRSMADKVNDFVNQTRYISDSRNWGKNDYWEVPAEFIRRGGDCEDFAIAKYVALRSLGVPEERLRIAIVQDTQKNIPHALLIVYTDEGAYYLDNQSKSLGAAGNAGRYRPVFSINREGWWLHTAPGATVMASAQ